MKKNSFIFLADAFGYGPITTLCLIAENLKKKLKGKFIFMGPTLCIKQAKCSQAFDELIEMDYSNEEINKNKDIFIKANKIIAVETTDILIYLINKYNLNNIYLIDNLFWMWDFLEPELKLLKKYYVSNVIDCTYNKKRIGSDFYNIVEVGALRKLNDFKKISSNNLLISLGGVESYMIDDTIIKDIYLKSIKIILKNKLIKRFNKIYIAGGHNIIDFLKKYISEENVEINTYSNTEYLKILYNSSYAIMSPGLGNFNEIISTNIKCLFLLPINYSQYLQRKQFLKMNLGFHFQKNKHETEIDNYLCEELGVKKVISNLYKYNFEDFDKELVLFFQDKDASIIRENFYNSVNKNGIEEICNDIAMEEK